MRTKFLFIFLFIFVCNICIAQQARQIKAKPVSLEKKVGIQLDSLQYASAQRGDVFTGEVTNTKKFEKTGLNLPDGHRIKVVFLGNNNWSILPYTGSKTFGFEHSSER